MLTRPLIPALPLSILLLVFLLHPTTATTTLHFFAHTSCNADTSIGAPFGADFADAASAGTCQDTPNGTVAIYIDSVDVGCSITAYTDPLCQTRESAALGAGKCFFLDPSGGIGGFEALCGAANTNSTLPTTSSVTSSASMMVITNTATVMPSNMSMTAAGSSSVVTAAGGNGNGTVVTMSKGPSATGTAGAGARTGLQARPSGSGAAEGEGGRWKRRVLRALVAMGSAEVVWAMV